MRILVVIVLLMIVYETNATSRLCGHNLDQALLVACGSSGFNSKLKKSVGLSGNKEAANDLINALSDIFLSEETNLMAKVRRRRNGIVDECCKSGCSFNELYAYCKEF